MSQVLPFACRATLDGAANDLAASMPFVVVPCFTRSGAVFTRYSWGSASAEGSGSPFVFIGSEVSASGACPVLPDGSYFEPSACALFDSPDALFYFWALAGALLAVAALEFVRKAVRS